MDVLLNHLPTLSLMAGLLVISGFFSSSETAFFSLKSYEVTRLSRDRNPVNRWTASLLNNPHKLLVTILLGNLIINLLYFSVSLTIEPDIRREYGNLGVVLYGLATLAAIIIFGEVTPKAIAVTIPRGMAYIVTMPMVFIQAVLTPIIRIVEKINHTILNFFDRKKRIKPETEEINLILETSAKRKILNSTEMRFIKEVINLDSVRAKEVMVPRVQLITLERKELTREHILQTVIEHRHTNYLVYEDNIDNVIGFINAKRFLLTDSKKPEDFLQKVYFIPEYSPLNYCLNYLKEKETSLSAVVDEYGGVSGIITIEDLVEEIVGEIQDEFDPEVAEAKEIEPGRWIIQGYYALRDLGELVDKKFRFNKVNTVGGFVIWLLDDFPEEGQTTIFEDLKFTVKKVDRFFVSSVEIERIRPSGEEVKS